MEGAFGVTPFLCVLCVLSRIMNCRTQVYRCHARADPPSPRYGETRWISALRDSGADAHGDVSCRPYSVASLNTEHSAAPPNIRVGIAGWSYADWQGYVYPPGTRDKLRYVAEYMDVVEVNSTFYRPPDERTAASWVRRTASLPSLTFTAKLHQDITHRGSLASGLVRQIHDGFEPLVAAGRLSHLLAQFKWDFSDSPASRRHLQGIREQFGELTNLTLELRHNSWQSPDALAFLRALDVTVANLDYPLARNSFNMHMSGVGEHAYLRLHGRNSKAWFDRKAGRDDTYNYLYSGEELDEIAGRAVRIAEMSKSLTLVANNHYHGKEAVNALEIKARVTGRKVAVPPELLKKYPRLKQIAKNIVPELDFGP